MPTLRRRSEPEELQRLIAAFLKAETDIINEIARLRSQGLIDYHAVASLERVQAILRRLENDCWTYVPRMIERQFYVRHPEARKPLDIPETVEKHAAGYANAQALTSEQTDIVQRLTMNLLGEIDAATAMVTATLQNALIGRIEPDIFRRVGLEQVTAMQAAGRGVYKELPRFVEVLRREGVTAFIDKAGRHWSLHTYGSMVLRTTSRQAEVLSVLTQDPDHDLYKISSHHTTCKRCAPLEGRVYSRSGTDPDFPPLAAAFGKVDKAGPNTLLNSWLNIHPNCLHQLIPWTPMGRSPEELRKIKDFSSFEKNPPTRDPRTEKQIEAYRLKERGRAKWLADYDQWERYRLTIPDDTPKTFATFQRHKQAGDDKYKAWEKAYRDANRLAKPEKSDILKETKSIAIQITDDAIQNVSLVQPTGWSMEQAARLQEAHRELLRIVKDKPVGTEAGAVYTPDIRLIERRIGADADQSVSLPRCSQEHISMHSHPSGQIFSGPDLEAFFYNDKMLGMTVVGNSGKVYAILKSVQYDGFRFGEAYFDLQPKLYAALEAQDPDGYVRIIEEFLKGHHNMGHILSKNKRKELEAALAAAEPYTEEEMQVLDRKPDLDRSRATIAKKLLGMADGSNE